MQNDIEGFLTRAEGEELRRLARGKQVLEIGCWKGRSTVYLADTAISVLTLDWFRGDEFAGVTLSPGTLPEALESFSRIGVADKINILVGDMHKTLRLVRLEEFSFAFYDSNHSYEDTIWALRSLGNRLYPGSTIAVHDYKLGEPVWEPTVRAVHKFREERGYSLRLVDSLAILERS